MKITNQAVDVVQWTISRCLASREEHPSSIYRGDVRTALEAARPYLEPSWEAAQQDCAGLRDAMGKLADEMAYDCTDAPARIRAVLAAHPAVAQDREGLRERIAEKLHDIDNTHAWAEEDRCADSCGIAYFARADAVLMLATHPTPAVPQPVDREALRMVLINYGIDVKMDIKGASEVVDAAVDRALAVLAGEQEQAQPQ